MARLTGETEVSGAAATYKAAYAYADGRGNRTSMAVTSTDAGVGSYTTSYVYDANNRLQTETKKAASAEKTQYFYDPNGNQITKITSVTTTGSGGFSISTVTGVPSDGLSAYDALNRLVGIVGSMGNVSYAYRPDGLRASKTLTSPTGIASTTIAYWDLTDIAAETANGGGAGGGTTEYLRGAGLIAAKAGSTYTYYDKNAHGDVYRLLNSGGAATTAYVYDAFGVQRSPSLTGSTDTNPFRYCGEYFDAETGSIYLRARYYAPGVGRFTQEDAVRGDPKNPGSLNLYVYCWGNPIRYTDPSGRYTRMAAMADSGSMSLEYHPDEKAYLHSYDADLAKIDKGWSKLDHIPWVGALSSLGHALWYIGVENDRRKAGLSLVNTIFMGLTPGEGGGKAPVREAPGVPAEGVGDPLGCYRRRNGSSSKCS